MDEQYSSHPRLILLDNPRSSANVGYVSDARVWNERYNILLQVHKVLAVNLKIISNLTSLIIKEIVITFGRSHLVPQDLQD